ncbi:M61 family metallopeptidase [Novosphingobium lentum]|uniref:M61 family metallopeptidase n=1 Tax=Novosphingobium lentum TaxID=145287 RepID=UPI00082DCDCA|nr:M61 family metallopeptidase [Novosphingobium lentum]
MITKPAVAPLPAARFIALPLAVLAATLVSTSALAQGATGPATVTPLDADGRSAPQAVPVVRSVPDARDVAYPGTIALDIDASDTPRGIYRVTETIPVDPAAASAGELLLLLPQWLPGNHGPTGTLPLLADIRFTVDGKPAGWTRDPVEVNAFHVAVPAGAKTLVARFIHTSPVQTSEGRITMTQEMLNLQWEKMSLYPAGHYVRQIRVKPTVTFPQGWTVFTALDGRQGSGPKLAWNATGYDTLVDSPIFAGLYVQRWDLGHQVSLDTVADKPDLLAIAPANLQTYRNLVDEAVVTFGSRHFDHYDFLLALTDRMGGIGLEHHRSSENQMEPKTFVDWDKMAWDRNVIAHEFTHSWDGKFRRSARLWTPDYRQPMQDNLLWVYEGQTQFWGMVLAARSGVQSKDVVLGMMASVAGLYAQGQPGRAWRSVEDTTHDPIIAARRPLPYASLSRAEDYYNEGAMVWLEADQIIRTGTKGARGLDDFARGFFGARDGDWGEFTYEFDDVVAALNAVYPSDWATFLRTRLQTPGQPAPLAGIERAGYRLVWKDEPNPYEKGRSDAAKTVSFTYSLGFALDKDGKVVSTLWDGPAFDAGVVTGTRIVAVNGTAYDGDTLKDAITSAKAGGRAGTAPIQLLVQRGDRFMTVPIDYHGGLRYPWLERATPGTALAGLDRLLAPRRVGSTK